MHRANIQQEYRTIYSDDLLKRLVSELSGKVEVSDPIPFESFRLNFDLL